MHMSGKWVLLHGLCQCQHFTNVEKTEMDSKNCINEGDYDSNDNCFQLLEKLLY